MHLISVTDDDGHAPTWQGFSLAPPPAARSLYSSAPAGQPDGELGLAIARVPEQQVFGISFRAGDVLQTVNDRPVKTLDDLQKALDDPRTA